MNGEALSPKVAFWCSWIAFLATFPAGMVAGRALAHGQDAAGSGIGIGLGMLGVGLMGGIVTAIFVSYFTLRFVPIRVRRLLACLPWFILAIVWWKMLLTPTGDRLFTWLEKF